LLLTGECGALGELLAASLVGLADVLRAKGELLLSQLGEVGGVGLALVFRLGLGFSLSILLDSIFLFSLSYGLASLLISQLGVTIVSAPAVCGLLVVLSYAGSAVAVTLVATTTTTTASTTTTAATLAATGSSTSRLTGSPAAILVRSYAAIPESVLVGAVGLLGPGLVAVPLGDGLGGVGSIALAMPHNGLLNCPRWWVGRPVGVELRVIAQQLVNVLGSNLRHLDELERLSRFALLDAQSAGLKEECESFPTETRDVALRGGSRSGL